MSDPVHRHRVNHTTLIHPTLLDHDEALVATLRRMVEEHRHIYPAALPSTMLLRITVEADTPNTSEERRELVATEPLTQRQQVEQMFGPISDTQWQWLKVFVARTSTATLDRTPRYHGKGQADGPQT